MQAQDLAAARKAPDSISLRVCPECGKNSRHTSLPREHWNAGERCPGTPVRVSYELAGWVRWTLDRNPEPPAPTPSQETQTHG